MPGCWRRRSSRCDDARLAARVAAWRAAQTDAIAEALEDNA